MQTRAELEAAIARGREAQALLEMGEYENRPPLAMEWLNRLRTKDGEFEGYGSITHSTLAVMMQDYADEGLAIARAHLLPIVPAGEARDGEFGFAWRSAREGWIAATRIKAAFMVVDATGSVFELSGNVTHWLPASKVPGPEVGG